MKISKLLGKDPVSSIEAAIANLAARRETLNGRLADATAKFEAARSARKSALASDPTADLSVLTQAVRDNEDEIETIQGVLHDLDEQHAEQEELLAKAKDEDVRAASAKELERVADAVDDAAGELDAAVVALGRAAAKMVAVLPASLQVADLHDLRDEGQSEHEKLVATVIAEGLASVFPAAFPVDYFTSGHGHTAKLERLFDLGEPRLSRHSRSEDLSPLGTSAAATALISQRLRDRAGEIVAGNLSPDLEDVQVRPKPAPKPTFQYIEIYTVDDFRYQMEADGSVDVVPRHSKRHVPEDVAAAAVEAGVALHMDTPEAQKAWSEQQAKRAANPMGGIVYNHSLLDSRNLGVIRPQRDAEAA